MIARSVPPARSLLRPLGIVGYDALEPALLAALATGEPLLLVSDHGAAKTLLQFDDLAGFPVVDESGRGSPVAANKLFPCIDELRQQAIGLRLQRHRTGEALGAARQQALPPHHHTHPKRPQRHCQPPSSDSYPRGEPPNARLRSTLQPRIITWPGSSRCPPAKRCSSATGGRASSPSASAPRSNIASQCCGTWRLLPPHHPIHRSPKEPTTVIRRLQLDPDRPLGRHQAPRPRLRELVAQPRITIP